jgi:lysozyme
MNYAKGIDVSHWNDKDDTTKQVDFSKMKANGASFVVCKSSQATFPDHKFQEYWQLAKNAGLPRGAYHFLVYNVDPRVQAEFMWSQLEADPGELPPVCDFEQHASVNNKAQDYLWGFLSTIEKLSGRVPFIYTGAYFFQQYVTKNVKAYARYPLWIAAYTSEPGMTNLLKRTPWKDWTMWQVSEKWDGELFGTESKQVDGNYFNGTEAELYAKFIKTPPIVPIPPVEPSTEEKINKLWDYHPELH